MAEAGADVVVPHMGLTTKGTIGAQTALTPGRGASSGSQAIARRRALRSSPDVLVLCHGGPIAEPEDVAEVLARTTGIAGFFGASSIERLPTEIAIAATVRRFKQGARAAPGRS